MTARLSQMVDRADAVRGVTPLDDRDLRGWHFVINGALLLHLSPFGFDEGMTGRYAYTQDSAKRCLEGIRRAEAVLAAWGKRPRRVLLLPERDNAILGLAAAKVLDVPAEPFGLGAADPAGLIVAYDLKPLPVETLKALADHRPGQVLWSHAAQWTHALPFAADLTTYLYQLNISPWQAGRLHVDPATQQPTRLPEPPGTVEQLAAEMTSATLEPDALADLQTLTALAVAAARAPAPAAPGAFQSAGRRRRHMNDSPVKSNRFL